MFGNLSAVQTDHSLIPWLKEFYPIIKEEIPDSSLTIAGKKPGQNIVNLCKELNINLIPSPKDMQPILDNADIYICPTALGGGLKLRVMDGLKNGLPVLTHEVSARGYDDFKERGFLFSYQDKQSFRRSLKAITDNTIKKEDVINMYQNIFSFDAGLKRMRKIIEENIYC